MAKDLNCGICGVGRPRGSCHVIQLTAEEKADLRRNGQKPQNEYIYCKPCWRTLSNPVTGPSVMKGLVQARLRQLGVDDAGDIAQRYYNRLVEKIKQRPS